MEQNQKKKMNKKSLISLVACIVVVAACALCTVGVLISRNYGFDNEASKTDEIVIEENAKGEMLATDEASLRKLLKEDKTYTIAITKDIYVKEPLEVNGTKTLVGDKSIIMDLNTVAKEKVLSVSADAKLILDGATIDGNGVASGIAVKDGGELECLSGNIVYPMPYGIVAEGKVNVEDITIDRSMHTGIYVESGGELHMTGGKIINCIQTGIATSNKAYAKVSKDAVIQKSAGSLFYNYGTLDITGGVFSDSYSNCIFNKGTLNIVSESDKMVEFFNSGRSVISSVAGTKVTIDGLYVHDITAHAMNLEKDSVADVKNVLVENTGKSCFYTNSSKLTMKAVEIKDAKTVCINLVNKSTVELEDITISNGGHRGIVNDTSTVTMKNITVDNMVGAGIITIGEKSVTTIEKAKISKVGKSGIGITGGTVTAKNIEITDAAGTSIYTVTDKSKTTVDGAKLVNSGKSAIGVSIGTLTAKNVEINGTKNTGVYIQKDAQLNLSDATLKGVERHGVANYFGTAVLKNVTMEAPARAGILNQGTLTGEKVTISKSGSRAMSLTDASTTNIKGLVINESKNQSVYADSVTSVHLTDFKIDKSGQSAFRITKSTDVLLKSGTITNANGDGIWVSENAKMKVQDTVITAPTKYGVEVYGTAEVTAVGVTVNAARAGFVNNGGTIIGNTLAVNDSTSRSLNLINKSTTSISGLTVKNAGDQAVYIDDTTKVVLKEIDIDTTKGAAIRASKSQNVSIKTGTIKNAGSDGVYVCDAAAIKVEAVDVLDSAGYGLMAYGAELTANSINVTNAKAGLVNNGGTVYGNTINIDTTTSRAVNLISGSTTKVVGLTVKNAGNQGVYAENSTVNLSSFTVDTTKSAAFCLGKTEEIDETAVENVTLTDGTIKNSGSTGIYIGKTAVAKVTGVTIENAGQHGIQNVGGKLTGTTLTINQSTNRALTMAKDSETDVKGLNITGTGNQAVYVDGGKESKTSVAGFNISDSAEAAVRIMNTKDVKLTDGTVNATTYGIAISGTDSSPASAIAEDVRIIRQENNKDYLVWIMKNSSLIMQNGTNTAEENQSILNGQDKPGIGVWIEKAGSFNLKGGKIANSKGNTSEGAGVYVCEDATFVMDGGVIENNETTNTSAGVAARGSFTMNRGKIQNNKASKGAGVMVRNTGTFTMTAGDILGNEASADGGGLFIQTSTADVEMTGGTIRGNEAKQYGGGIYMSCSKAVNLNNVNIQGNTAVEGGGVCVASASVTTMNGGSISDNHVSGSGAGVSIRDTAKFILNDGVISGNEAKASGGAMIVRSTRKETVEGQEILVSGFVMNGGTITDNHAWVNNKNGGGAIFQSKNTQIELNGGTISKNTSLYNGGGVYVSANTTFLLNGTAFTENSASIYGDDIYLASKITLKKALTSVVAVGPESYSVGKVIATNGGITEDEFKASMKNISIDANNGAYWSVDDNGALKAAVVLNGVSYANLDEALQNVTSESTIMLSQNQEISSPVTVNGTLTITCTDNVSITASENFNGNMFTVAEGGKLVLIGAAKDKRITLAGRNVAKYGIQSDGTLELTHTAISNVAQQGVRINKGTATLNSVDIKAFGTYGLVVKKGTVTAKNTLIDNVDIATTTSARIGIAAHGGTLTLDNVTVQNLRGTDSKGKTNNNHGIDHQGGQLIVTANETVDGGNKGLYIYNVKGHGIYSQGGSMNISKITIDGNGQTRAGIQLTDNNSSDNQVSNATITNCSVKIQLKNVSQLMIGDTTVSTTGTQVNNYDTDGNKQ